MDTRTGVSVKVGIFVVVAILLLLGLSLRVDENLFQKQRGYNVEAHFRDVKGLEIGAPVMLGGMEIGTVTAMNFNPEKGQVKVRMFIREPYRLKQDSTAGVSLQSMLGQYFLDIEYGNPRSPDLAEGGVLETRDSIDVNSALKIVGEVGREVKTLASEFNQNQKKLTEQISSLIEENRENLKKTTQSFAELGPKINETASSLNTAIDKINRGEGTLGKLLTDDSLYNQLSGAADGLTSLTADVRTGDGALSNLIYSDELSVSAKNTFSSVQNAADNLNSMVSDNRKSFDDFMTTLRDVAPRLTKTVNNLEEISRKMNEGEGTLGKMVNDDALYDNTKNAVDQIRATFEEAEEQSVLRTVLSLVIGPVM